MLPNINDYPVLIKYIKLQGKLLTERNTETIKRICLDMIGLTSEVRKAGKKYNDKKLAERPGALVYDFAIVDPYKRLAIIYEKEGNIQQAISVCNQAIAAGFESDGTKKGMQGRIEKLMKKGF